MPIHDWSRVPAGLFHDFHQSWTIEIRNALNRGLLPDGYLALAEQFIDGPAPDIVTLQRRDDRERPSTENGGVAIELAPPRAWYTTRAEIDHYTERANRIAIHHPLGEVVAVIEIVSPGNKNSQRALAKFVRKTEELLHRGVNLLVVDLFPPTSRDPQGIHKAIWDEIVEQPFELPPGRPLTVAAYSADRMTAYVEPVAVGEPLPSLPIFLDLRKYIPAPLDATYEKAWQECPEALREYVTRSAD